MDFVYKIRFLDNQLTGREISLRSGSFTLGQDEADLFANPETVTGNITLAVSNEGVTLAEKCPLWVEGKAQTLDSGDVLPTGVCIDADGIRFCLGAPDADLQQVKCAPRLRHRGAPRRRQKTIFYSMAAITLLAAVLLSGEGAIFSNAKAQSSTLARMADIKAQLARMAKDPRLSAVHLEWSDADVLQIKGWCSHENDIKNLMSFLKSNGVNYTLAVISQDGLIENVETVLQQNGYENINIIADDAPGKVIILGQVEQNAQWQNVTQLLTDIPGLKSWQVKAEDDREMNSIIESLRTANLLSLLSVQRIDDRIILSGKLKSKDRKALSVVMRKHMLDFPATEEVIYQNINAGVGALGIFPSPIVSVGGNSQSLYLELESGARLQIGAHLPGGYRIQNIDEENGIELARQGELLHVPFNF